MIIHLKALSETYVIQSRLFIERANGGKGAWTTWSDLAGGYLSPESAQMIADQMDSRTELRQHRVVRRTDTLVETA